MNCTDYAVLLEKLSEGAATPEEEAALRRHEAECPACAAHRRAFDSLPDGLNRLMADVPPPPEGFHQAWTKRVEEEAMENRTETNPRVRRSWTRILSAAAALVFVVGGTLLSRDALSPRSAGQSADYGAAVYETTAANGTYALGAAYDMAQSDTVALSRSTKDAAPAEPAEQVKKIIRTAHLTIGTKTYEDSLAALRRLCEDSGGWVSYTSESADSDGNRRAYLTLRIPTDTLDAYLADSVSLGRIISREESASDVTDSYYDTQARLDTQLALMARLQALVTDAASLADLLALEEQIADTQYEIDRLQSSLAATDREVDYATLDVTLREETAATDITDGGKSLGERLLSALETGAEALMDFAADMAVFLAAALPFIGIVAVLWIAVWLIRKKRK